MAPLKPEERIPAQAQQKAALLSQRKKNLPPGRVPEVVEALRFRRVPAL
jgi:hypothetical protein